jgi:hypothetical protein
MQQNRAKSAPFCKNRGWERTSPSSRPQAPTAAAAPAPRLRPQGGAPSIARCQQRSFGTRTLAGPNYQPKPGIGTKSCVSPEESCTYERGRSWPHTEDASCNLRPVPVRSPSRRGLHAAGRQAPGLQQRGHRGLEQRALWQPLQRPSLMDQNRSRGMFPFHIANRQSRSAVSLQTDDFHHWRASQCAVIGRPCSQAPPRRIEPQQCRCVSMRPGIAIMPAASITSAQMRTHQCLPS